MAEDETDLQLDDLEASEKPTANEDVDESDAKDTNVDNTAAEEKTDEATDNSDVDAVAIDETEAKKDEGNSEGVDAEALIAELPEIQDLPKGGKDLEAVYDIPVQVSAVLGKSHMQVSELLKLGRGAVVELDRKVGEAIDIYVNNRLVARGEVVVVENRLGITMTEIIKAERS
ncbi:MAG: Flagellar motor switch protein FliN [Alphaproteobacteria bacterium MarineAlpha3_Bin5]|nr:MAG: Flagellar motor switch protein FliN [Alphaproteobacteria bacterium MarineAlpha3_Bin5]